MGVGLVGVVEGVGLRSRSEHDEVDEVVRRRRVSDLSLACRCIYPKPSGWVSWR